MTLVRSSTLLRRSLAVDAAMSGAAGMLMATGAGALAAPLGLPASLLTYAGLALLPFAGLLAWLATRVEVPRAAIWAVIACNLVWAVESIALLLTGWVAPTILGHAFVIAQALAVAVITEFEFFGLRRSRPALAVA